MNQIDLIGRNAEMNDSAGRGEVFSRHDQAFETEVRQRGDGAGRVVERRFDEDVDVLGVTRPAMERARVPANDDGLNVVRVQTREQFFEVPGDVLR